MIKLKGRIENLSNLTPEQFEFVVEFLDKKLDGINNIRDEADTVQLVRNVIRVKGSMQSREECAVYYQNPERLEMFATITYEIISECLEGEEGLFLMWWNNPGEHGRLSGRMVTLSDEDAAEYGIG